MGRYPVFLDLEERPVLVVGGGQVAARKMPALLASGAAVTVVSPELHPGLWEHAREGRIRWIPRRYVEGDESGFILVFALTDSTGVNDRVVGRTRGFVNSATFSRGHPIFLPFSVSAGPLTVAVGSEQGDPVLVRDVGKTLEELLNGRGIPDFLEEHIALRETLRKQGKGPGEVSELLASFSVAWAMGTRDREARLEAYGALCGRDLADAVRRNLEHRENA